MKSRWFSIIMAAVLVAGLALGAAPQKAEAAVNTYTFIPSKGTYSAISGTTLCQASSSVSCDDNVYSPAIGFNYNYNGTAYSTAYVSTNGFLCLGGSPSTTEYSPISQNTTSNCISAMGNDLVGQQDTTYGLLSYTTSGTTGSRVFVTQWQNWHYYWRTTTYNFQIRLYEASGVAEVVYGSTTANSTASTYQVGLRGTANTDYNNRSCANCANWDGTSAGGANTATMTMDSDGTLRPASGLTWTWAPSTSVNTYTTADTYTWTTPTAATSCNVELWGGGGGGGRGSASSADSGKGGGGAGGQFASSVITAPSGSYTVVVGGGGAGGTSSGNGSAGSDSTFATNVVVAKGGAGGTNNSAGGTGSTTNGVGTTLFRGGNGTAGGSSTSGSAITGGAGGGGAGSGGAGGDASGNTAGTGRAASGGNGGAGLTSQGTGNTGNIAGGGGGGGYRYTSANQNGGQGAAGRAVITCILDPYAPAAPTVSSTNPASPANNNSPYVIGSAEANSTVKLYTNNSCTSAVAATGTAAAFASTGLTVSVSDNTTTNFYATATDAAGNVSSCSATSVTYVEDSNAPTVTVTTFPTVNNANKAAVTLSGTCETASGTVSLAVTDAGSAHTVNTTATCTAGAWTATLDLTTLNDGTLTATATQTDAAGNTGTGTKTATKDVTAPSVTINQAVAQADPTNTSPINFTVVFSEITTDFATGDVIITGTAGGTKTATVSGSGTTYTVAVTGMTTYGTVIATIAAGVATDAAGNSNTDSTSTDNTVTWDAVPPSAPTVTSTNPTSPANNNSPSIIGFAEAGSTVRLYTSSDCSGPVAATGTAASFTSPGIAVGVADNSTTNYRATATDAAGNVSVCSATYVTYVEDSAAPWVSSTTPANNDVCVALNSTVTINLSADVDCNTVTPSNVTISPMPTTWVKTSCASGVAVFTPSGQTGTKYTITAGTGVQDAAGNALAPQYQFSYRTPSTFTSTGTGGWSTAGTWVENAVPAPACDSVVIASPHVVTLDGNKAIGGSLTVDSGSVLDWGAYEITSVGGTFANNGTMKQTKTLDGSIVPTPFLYVPVYKYCGVEITPQGTALGATTVAIEGNQVCSPEADGLSPVKRCYYVDPTNDVAADIKFCYQASEIQNVQQVPDALKVWNWHGAPASWHDEGNEANSGNTCTTIDCWVRADGITTYSPFMLMKFDPTAVTLAEFAAAQANDAIVVTWQTASELDNRGFNLWRGTSEAGPDLKLNETLIPSQSQGLPGSGFEYTWEDRADLIPGATYWYWLEDLDVNGVLTRHDPISVDYVTPTAVGLAAFGGVASVAGPALGGLAVLALAALGGVAVRRRR